MKKLILLFTVLFTLLSINTVNAANVTFTWEVREVNTPHVIDYEITHYVDGEKVKITKISVNDSGDPNIPFLADPDNPFITIDDIPNIKISFTLRGVNENGAGEETDPIDKDFRKPFLPEGFNCIVNFPID